MRFLVPISSLIAHWSTTKKIPSINFFININSMIRLSAFGAFSGLKDSCGIRGIWTCDPPLGLENQPESMAALKDSRRFSMILTAMDFVSALMGRLVTRYIRWRLDDNITKWNIWDKKKWNIAKQKIGQGPLTLRRCMHCCKCVVKGLAT